MNFPARNCVPIVCYAYSAGAVNDRCRMSIALDIGRLPAAIVPAPNGIADRNRVMAWLYASLHFESCMTFDLQAMSNQWRKAAMAEWSLDAESA
ncbi:hypothetical protein ABZ942_21970 [Nocardia sp. NPDC046473]|uniref:hypothetical protein n=1 Tax=Nocardia sp. NPDC046473 TaxID=3155733 RepID=UPI0033D19A41